MQIQIKVVLTRYISIPIRNLVQFDCGDLVFTIEPFYILIILWTVLMNLFQDILGRLKIL